MCRTTTIVLLALACLLCACTADYFVRRTYNALDEVIDEEQGSFTTLDDTGTAVEHTCQTMQATEKPCTMVNCLSAVVTRPTMPKAGRSDDVGLLSGCDWEMVA